MPYKIKYYEEQVPAVEYVKYTYRCQSCKMDDEVGCKFTYVVTKDGDCGKIPKDKLPDCFFVKNSETHSSHAKFKLHKRKEFCK